MDSARFLTSAIAILMMPSQKRRRKEIKTITTVIIMYGTPAPIPAGVFVQTDPLPMIHEIYANRKTFPLLFAMPCII